MLLSDMDNTDLKKQDHIFGIKYAFYRYKNINYKISFSLMLLCKH